MTENKRFRLGYVCGDYGLIDNDEWIDLHSMSENSEKNVKLCINKMNELAEENEELKSTIAQLIEQNRKNNDLLLSDIRILGKALWCGGCENDYGRLKELRKEFMR